MRGLKVEQSRVLRKTEIRTIYVTKQKSHLTKDVVIAVLATVSILGKLVRGLR